METVTWPVLTDDCDAYFGRRERRRRAALCIGAARGLAARGSVLRIAPSPRVRNRLMRSADELAQLLPEFAPPPSVSAEMNRRSEPVNQPHEQFKFPSHGRDSFNNRAREFRGDVVQFARDSVCLRNSSQHGFPSAGWWPNRGGCALLRVRLGVNTASACTPCAARWSAVAETGQPGLLIE